VVLAVIYSVYADSVQPQLLELGNVAVAYRRVGERVFGFAGTTWLIIDALDIESGVAIPERYG